MKDTMGESAYQALKEKILTLDGGAYLSARQFASEIGMSYTPVREAFLRLQREGSIKQIPNVGFFVETMDLSDLMQACQVRECIEPFILNKVFHLITPAHIAQMRDITFKQKAALEQGDIVSFVRLDIDMHEVPIRITGNKYFQTFYRQFREQNMFCSNRVAVQYTQESIDEHLAFIDTLETKTKAKALDLLMVHLDNVKRRLKDGYTQFLD